MGNRDLTCKGCLKRIVLRSATVTLSECPLIEMPLNLKALLSPVLPTSRVRKVSKLLQNLELCKSSRMRKRKGLRMKSWKRSLMMWDYSRWTLSVSAWLMTLVQSSDILPLDFSSPIILSLQECSFRCKWLGIITVLNAKRIWLPNLFLSLKLDFRNCEFASFSLAFVGLV